MARTRGALQPAAPIIIIFVVSSVSLFGVRLHKKGSIIIIILDMIIIIVTISFIINYMGSKNWQERDTVHGAGVSQPRTSAHEQSCCQVHVHLQA